jgi:hypothetical protein
VVSNEAQSPVKLPRNFWRVKEVNYLKERYQTTKAKNIAIELNRTLYSVTSMILVLGLKKNKKRRKVKTKEAANG